MSTLNGAPRRADRDRLAARTAPERDPLEGVLGMGPRLPANVLAAALAFALVLHAGVAAAATAAVVFADMLQWQRMVRASIEAKISQTFDIDVVKPEPPPEPEPPVEEEVVKPEPEPEPPPPPPVKQEAPREEEPPPPPAAAQAGAVLTEEPSPDEPVDLTDNTFVTGSASTYAGGTTQAGGTSQKAVYNKAATAAGVPGGTGTAPAPPAPKVDRSRAASLVNKANLERCPWPAEADAEQMDEASVLVEIKVRPNGTAASVAVLQDPGYGFGREARKCAMRERYHPALDVNGSPIPSGYKVRMHFER